MPSQGDIVLIPTPFTDLSSQRRLPVIVISNNQYNATTADCIVVAMTSNLIQTPHSFVITTSDLILGVLNRPGRVRVDRIYTMAQRIIVKNFGRVSDSVLDSIRQLLMDLCRP